MPSRRRFLESGALAAIAATAGCTDALSTGDGSPTASPGVGTETPNTNPDVGDSPYPLVWLPDPSTNEQTAISAQFVDVAGVTELDAWTDIDVQPSYMPDLSFELPLGIYWTLDFSAPSLADGDDYGRVIHGDVNPDEMVSILPESYSEQSTRDGFTLYEDEGTRPAVGVAEEYLVVGPKTGWSGSGGPPVETLLDARGGERLRLEAATRALRAAGDGLFVSFGYDSEGLSTNSLQGMHTICRALDTDYDQMTSTWTTVFESEDTVPDESAIAEFEQGQAENSPFPEESFTNKTDGRLLTVEASMKAKAYWAALQ